jgi:O-antigen ligase
MILLWALAGLLAGAVATVVVLRPRVALLLLVLVEVSNASGVLGTVRGVSLYLVALGLASAALVLGVLTGRLRVRRSRVLLLAAVFVAAQAPSVLVATDRDLAWSVLLTLTKDLWFVVVVVLLASATANAWLLARAYAGVMAALGGLAVVNEFVLGNTVSFWGFAVVSQATGVGVATARHAGPFEDPNFWGRLLVPAVLVALALVAEAWQRSARRTAALWGGAALLLCGAVYLTQSRGALLGLGVASTLFLLLLGPRSRRLVLVLPAVLGLLLLVPGVGSRLATLAEVAGESEGPQDYSLVERTATQQIALAMFLDHPGLGVGLGNVAVRWDDYSDRADIEVQRVVAPHNLYLELAAEGGVIGLAGAVVFFVGVLVLTFRMTSAFTASPGKRAPPERLLALGVTSALIGWAITSLFLHLSHLRLLMVVVAVVAVLDAQRAWRTESPTAKTHGRALRPILTKSVATAGVVLGLGAVAFNVASRPVWVAQVPVTVLTRPVEGAGSFVDPYSREVTTLPNVVFTYAAAIEHTGIREAAAGGTYRARDGYTVDVDESSETASMVVEVHGGTRAGAIRLAEEVAEVGTAGVNSSPALNRLATALPGRASAAPGRDWSAQRLVLIVGALPIVLWMGGVAASLSRLRREGVQG